MSRIIIAILALTTLAGCGLRGGLERPAPMFGAERAAWEAEQKRKAEAEAAAKAAAAAQPAPAPTGERQRIEVPVNPAQPPQEPTTLQPQPTPNPFRPN